jgi:hypothetical protein
MLTKSSPISTQSNLFHIHYKQNLNKNWEKFRKQRNFVTKLKRKSMKTYFLERCSGGTKSVDFWKTIKPFFSKKGSSGEQKIVLNESDKIVNDQKE